MGVSLFLGPSFLWPSQQAGDWSLHDIGLGEIAFFFSPRPWWSGCSRVVCVCVRVCLSLSDPPPRAHACVCVYIVVGSVRHGRRMDGVWCCTSPSPGLAVDRADATRHPFPCQPGYTRSKSPPRTTNRLALTVSPFSVGPREASPLPAMPLPFLESTSPPLRYDTYIIIITIIIINRPHCASIHPSIHPSIYRQSTYVM